VALGERGRIVETVFALIGLGEDEGHGAGRPAGLLVGRQLAQVADELHRMKIFVAFAAFDARGIDEDQHARALLEERVNHRKGVG